MIITQRGNAPKPKDWWYQLEHVCCACKPPTKFRIEPKDPRLPIGTINLPHGGYMIDAQRCGSNCPVCGSNVITRRPEDM